MSEHAPKSSHADWHPQVKPPLPTAFEAHPARGLSNELNKTDEGPDTVGDPIYNVEGERTVDPRDARVPLDVKGIQAAFGDISLDKIAIPLAEVTELPVTNGNEESILDHNRPLPPSPAMQKFRNLIARFRLPAILLGGLMAAKGAALGVEGFKKYEANQAEVKSAVTVAMDSVASGLSEISAANAVSGDTEVELSDGFKSTVKGVRDAGSLAITKQFVESITVNGDPSGVMNVVLPLASSEVSRTLVEGARDEVVKDHSTLVSELSPFVGPNVDEVAKSILRDGSTRSSPEKNLELALTKVYGASSSGMLENIRKVGIEKVYHGLEQVDRDIAAADQYKTLLSQPGGNVKIVDVTLATTVFGSTMNFGNSALEVAGRADGFTGSPDEVVGKMRAVQDMLTYSVSEDAAASETRPLFLISYTIGGPSLSKSFGSELSEDQSAATVGFSHTLARVTAEGGHLDANAVKSVRGVIDGQIRLNLAEKALVGLEGNIGDLGTHDGAVSRVPEAVQKVIDAKNSLELQEKILSAATGGDPSVQAMMDQLKQANDSSVRIILEQGKLISGVMSSGATDGYSWDAQIASL